MEVQEEVVRSRDDLVRASGRDSKVDRRGRATSLHEHELPQVRADPDVLISDGHLMDMHLGDRRSSRASLYRELVVRDGEAEGAARSWIDRHDGRHSTR